MVTSLEAPSHAESTLACAARADVDPSAGLSSAEAAARLAAYGPNALPERRGRSAMQALAAQFTNFLMLLLLSATALSLAIGEYADAVTIAAIVLLSALLGFIQEWRAERAITALRRMTAPEARVMRGATVVGLPASQVVPGDVVLLDAGNYVPADLRLLESHALTIDEASLTGESEQVEKQAEVVLHPETGVADRLNCAFAGTVVATGRGRGLVIATGAATEIGQIATLIETPTDIETPLQRRMSELARYLGAGAIAVSLIVFAVGAARGLDTAEIALTAISLSVAAVPEGLPAVVVIALALGMQRMAQRKALVRRLAAVETLGSATVIASDKTGTLTRGEMTVTALYLGPERPIVRVTELGTRSEFRVHGSEVDPTADGQLRQLLLGCALCNDARLEGHDGITRVVGDATEGALLVAARKAGLERAELEEEQPRIEELPFSPERARMTTVHRRAGQAIAYMKGAPEVVLSRCANRSAGAAVGQLLPGDARQIMRVNNELAADGLRVLAMAYRDLPLHIPEDVESEMTFLGLVAMQDPPREEARAAVADCRSAGIRPIMITGDHAATAEAIARQVGLSDDDSPAIATGAELERASDDEMRRIAATVSVYGRVTAEQKVRIVEALQANGEVVAVTGDGVNDAPALHSADIGVAMGRTGTDVAKEAADIVVADDNFATIVAAVEEGRHIFDNIRNFVVYLLGGNIGELIVVFVGVVSGLPLPLLPIQILFVNLVTDGPPALALGVEPGDPAVLSRPPRSRREQLMTPSLWATVVFRGLILGTTVLAIYILWYEGLGRSEEESRTVAIATLVVAHVLKAFTCRSLYRTAWELGPLSNPWLLAGCAASLGALLAVLYVPGLSDAFKTETLHLNDWFVIGAFAIVPPTVIELAKHSPWRLRP